MLHKMPKSRFAVGVDFRFEIAPDFSVLGVFSFEFVDPGVIVGVDRGADCPAGAAVFAFEDGVFIIVGQLIFVINTKEGVLGWQSISRVAASLYFVRARAKIDPKRFRNCHCFYCASLNIESQFFAFKFAQLGTILIQQPYFHVALFCCEL